MPKRLLLVRAGRAIVYPFLHRSNKIRPIEWRQRASVTGIPSPANEIVGSNVRENLRETAATIQLGIFQLTAKLSGSSAHKNHFHLRRRQSPFRIPRRHVRAWKIRVLVARLTPHPVNAVTIRTTLYILRMDVTVVALQWSVA